MPSWPNTWKAEVPAGYTRAGNIITYYDGGNHAMYGRLLSCARCGSAVVEGEAVVAHDKHHADLKAQFARLSFYEEDRPLEEVLAAYERGIKGMTVRPSVSE